MTRHYRITLRIVFYKEEGRWIAHCLEFDLLGDGDTKQSAMERLHQAIALQIEQSLKHNNPANLFSPADGEFQRMFAAGTDVTEAELSMPFERVDNFDFDKPDVRVYSDNDLVPA